MQLSATNYKEILPKELLKQAGKCTVRECDELEKGQYQAYVDDGANSFDVSLTITRQEVTAHTCDCQLKTDFCRHKTALFIQLQQRNTTNKTAKSSPKEKQLTAILAEADPEAVKNWVREIVSKNEDLRLSFLQRFSTIPQSFTPEQVYELSKTAIKAVIKTKKYLDSNELKKIIDLWAQVFEPVIQQYIDHPEDRPAYRNFNAILDSCESAKMRLNTTAINKIDSYAHKLVVRIAEVLLNLRDETLWQDATGHYIEHVQRVDTFVLEQYWKLLSLLYMATGQPRKRVLAERLISMFKENPPKEGHIIKPPDPMLLKMAIDNELFRDNFTVFLPLRFDNDHNTRLIRELITIGEYRLAERHARAQIQSNYYDHYSASYFALLQIIYRKEADIPRYYEATKQLLPHNFNLEDYEYYMENTADAAEKKVMRTRLINKATHAIYDTPEAVRFLFGLMDKENNYKKMLGYINNMTPYSLIASHAAGMIQADSTLFIKKLLEKEDITRPSEPHDDTDALAQLTALVRQHYPSAQLELLLTQSRGNKFVAFLKEQLT